jgi:hypothetical protein
VNEVVSSEIVEFRGKCVKRDIVYIEVIRQSNDHDISHVAYEINCVDQKTNIWLGDW